MEMQIHEDQIGMERVFRVNGINKSFRVNGQSNNNFPWRLYKRPCRQAPGLCKSVVIET
jgi:hypothetical protein